ncbi:YraN family protein [Riemerella columbipharyngis]|uniref:UPF0102 protein SAMN05421544_102169 n=1 Tax=Riemerella columbipharyngis TaxID=1071918 RepID=A0A1G6ZQF2_9FLAO|nr:YraN family protein [Riemerella columbipharyngis]SDE04780.1 putative endonuclease [Riemerella columbipharyngis]
MAEHNDFGKYAEQLAEKYLIDKDYVILTKNYRYQKAEIDIIAQKENTIAIVEVKARQSNAVMAPYEAVGKKKMKLLVLAADAFLQDRGDELEARFDIISITISDNKEPNIVHIENAFEVIDVC